VKGQAISPSPGYKIWVTMRFTLNKHKTSHLLQKQSGIIAILSLEDTQVIAELKVSYIRIYVATQQC